MALENYNKKVKYKVWEKVVCNFSWWDEYTIITWVKDFETTIMYNTTVSYMLDNHLRYPSEEEIKIYYK